MADIATVLWTKHIKHNPSNPKWINRDRFVLSNGHGSMLLYSLLHLTGYSLPLGQLKKFRQIKSLTPGHPEYLLTPGVETTTGPLGQGFANAVGMALSEQLNSNFYNSNKHQIIDNNTYVFLGDGCLMEGITHEAASFAGLHKLKKLIAFWDDNSISIDSEKGNIEDWFSEDVLSRFKAYGWNIIENIDGHDFSKIDSAIKLALKSSKPTLIQCKTIIGKGSPNKENTGSVHGAPLGEEELKLLLKGLRIDYDLDNIPEEIYNFFDARKKGKDLNDVWDQLLSSYKSENNEKSATLQRVISKKLPDNWDNEIDSFLKEIAEEKKDLASRKSSHVFLEYAVKKLPEIIGGSADLTPSNLTFTSSSKSIVNGSGNYIHYGVREFGMSAIMNGITLYGLNIPYGATFLVFSDYSRNAIRLSALMKIKVIYVFTHDSIGLGEDGPTHQPVEHASSLRLIPNLDVWRPCDTYETVIAWNNALIKNDGPSCILLSRQTLPFVSKIENTTPKQIQKGAYAIVGNESPDLIIISSGSEVSLAVNAAKVLSAKNHKIRVVSMPCSNVFDKQSFEYKTNLLPKKVPKIAIEAGVTNFWYKYAGGDNDIVLGVDSFGESGQGKDLFNHFKITEEDLIKSCLKILNK
jgi:transketolase